MNIAHYAKSIVQIVAAVLVVLVATLTDGRITPAEFVNIVLAVAAAVLVFWVPNLASGVARYWKAIIGWISAAGSALVLILAPGVGFGAVSLSDWLTVILAGLGALGIGIIPNATKFPALVQNIAATIPSDIGPGTLAANLTNRLTH